MAMDEEAEVQYEKVAKGVVRVPEQTFDAYGTLYSVLKPFEARVRQIPDFGGKFTAEYPFNGTGKPLVKAPFYDTEVKAVKGLLVQMALKSRDDSLTRHLLEEIVVQKEKESTK